MSAKADANIEIEPLTKEELKKRGTGSSRVLNDPEYPKDWLDRDIPVLVEKGFKYYKKTTREGKVYMVLRLKNKDKGLGTWTDEREAKLFHFFPNLGTVAGTLRPAPWVPQTQSVGNPQGRSFLSTPISRVAIIPRDYVPTINVIRYFQMVKEMGYPGDFSGFINDMVTHHMHDCHGVELPYVFREEDIAFEGENKE